MLMPDPTERAIAARDIMEAIATASIAPSEALSRLRHLLDSSQGSDMAEAAYQALRSLVWSFVSGREAGGHLDLWADFILRVRQLLRNKASPLSERFTVLADFLEQTGRFAQLHPKEELRRRKHVGAILKVLDNQRGSAARATIARDTKLRDANLSRLLANLASAGWVTRRNEGREVVVSLTTEGALQAEEVNRGIAVSVGDTPFANPNALAVVNTHWKQTGCALAITDDEGGLLSCDDNFALLFGIPDRRMLFGKDVGSLRNDLAKMAGGSDDVAPDEIALADGRIVHVVEHRGDGKSLWLGADVTPYRRRIEEYKRRERELIRKQEYPARRSGRHEATVVNRGPPTDISEAMWPVLASLRNDVLTPINSINSFAQLLMRDSRESRLTSNHDDLLAGIVNQSNQLRTLLKDIMDVGESLQTSVPAQASVRPTDLVAEIIANLTYKMRHSAVSLSMTPSKTPFVQTDQRALRGVMLRAVIGIIEMTASGGSVAIETALDKSVIVMRVFTRSVDRDYSAFGIASRTLASCELAARHFGGTFGFGSGTDGGISATLSWPVVRHVARTRAPRNG